MNTLQITRTNGNVPKSLAGEDYISGFIAYIPAADFPETAESEDAGSSDPSIIQAVSTIDAAEALGITSDSESWSLRMLHYQLSEIFRINSGVILYLGVFPEPEDWNFKEITTLQNYADGSIRQMAVWAGAREFSVDDVTTIQGVADSLDDENAPLSVLYAPKVTSVSDLPTDVAGSNNCRVSVVIGQAGSGTAAELYDDEANLSEDDGVSVHNASVSCLGVVLGLLSSASVHQSISWVKEFPTGISLPAFGDGTLYRDLDKGDINRLDTARYLFPVTHVGQSGSYMNDSHTMDSATSDYAMIESVRTMDKAVRGVRTYVIPELGGNLYIDADTGKLQSYSISHLETTAGKALEDMEKAGEISGYSVSIDPDQDVLSTSTVEIVMKIVAVGVMRTIKVKIGFSTSL